ncbi:tetratricopeptide repeat protein, partial [Reichenbachiella sp.]|uniref:O-linked N-acetylglucosamine transferase family protein n=1 Tax=Reichenbachiella sp. TaxID=2184521 RepID=UPI0032990FC6
FVNLGMAYENRGEATKAMKVYREIISRLPENDLFKLHIETLCPNVAHSNEQIDNYRTVVKEALLRFDQLVPLHLSVEKLDHSYAFPSFSFTYQGKNVKEIKALWGEFYAKRIKPVTLGPKNSKPKLGFLVTHGHEEVFIKGGCGLIKNLSVEKFEITVLVNGEAALNKIRNFISREDIHYENFNRDLSIAVQEISALNLDFLYYWEVGSDPLNYFLPFFQLARVQISSWGSPYTSGNPRIQHYWSSKWVENENYADHYSEKVTLFEPMVFYYYPIQVPEIIKVREDFGFPKDRKVYLCIQTFNKFHPDFDILLKGILEKDPKALIALTMPKHQTVINRLKQRFEQTIGPLSLRILFVEKVPIEDYPQRIALADVCIDTPHYAGVNTTYETLQMGTPVVSLPGEFQRGKYTEAVYRTVGLDEFIPKNNTEYVDLAVRLANEPQLKKELIDTFKKNSHRLFEQQEIVSLVEKFLLDEFEKIDPLLSQNQASALEWLEKGNLHKEHNQIKPAFDALNNARQLDPSNPKILKQFAELLSDIGNNKDAQIAYQKALALSPEDPEILNNLGGLLLENQQFDEAIPLLKKSAQINPNQQSAFVNLGLAYENNGEIEKAKDVYSKINSRLADDDLFKMHIETLCPNIAQSNKEINEYRSKTLKTIQHFDKLVQSILTADKIDSCYAFPPFSFTYQGRNVKEIKSLWGNFYSKRIQPVTLGPKNEKPKVGFLVTQSHEGVFMKDVGGILKNLSSDKFDLVVLANGHEALKGLKSFVNRNDLTYVSFSKQLGRAVQEIASLNLDFLYYWEIGSDALNYFLPYFQLARIQISSWGSAFTSGNPRVQYYWSSKWLENDDYPDHYSEQVVLFENLPTYYYRSGESAPPHTRKDFDLPENSRIYLCVQSMSKIHPDFDEILLGILEADEMALICLTTPKQDALVEQLMNRLRLSLGAHLDRIRVIKKIPHQQYLQLIKLADVCLDPPHYSGANTTYETLQMGTPVVSLPGEFQRGKYTEAIYRILELEQFIPQTKKEYVELAVKWANDEEAKAVFFQSYEKKCSLLFEQQGIIDEIEGFLTSKFSAI